MSRTVLDFFDTAASNTVLTVELSTKPRFRHCRVTYRTLGLSDAVGRSVDAHDGESNINLIARAIDMVQGIYAKTHGTPPGAPVGAPPDTAIVERVTDDA